MKKFVALSVVAVSVCGSVCAETPWKSVADAVVVVQDKELQEQAQKSAQHIVDAVNEFMLLVTKKLADESNQQDKARLKEIITQLEELLGMYRVAFEEGDPSLLDSQAQQEVTQRAQEFVVQCMPLMTVLAEKRSLQVDDALAKTVRVELFKGVQAMLAQIKSSL